MRSLSQKRLKMVRNSLSDLNNHLFETLERLNDEDLTDEQLKKEIDRAQSICSVSRMIIENANTVISAQRLINEYGDNTHSVTPLISFMNGKNE